jgi:hypothetical protein
MIKKLLLAAAFVATAATAQAGDIYVDGGATDLGQCDGRASAYTQGNQTILKVERVRNCTFISIDGRQDRLQEGFGGFYSGTFYVKNNDPRINVTIHSKSRAHETSFTVINRQQRNPNPPANIYLSATLGIKKAYLPGCGGEVRLTSEYDRNGNKLVTLVFDRVQNCSRFDILSNNGDDFGYPQKTLGGREGDRAGSFTLPQRVLDFGNNGVKVIVRSISGKTDDVIHVQFLNF